MDKLHEEIMKVCDKYPSAVRMEALVRSICVNHQLNVHGTNNVNQIYQLGRIEALIIGQIHSYFAPILNPTSPMLIEKPVDKKDMH